MVVHPFSESVCLEIDTFGPKGATLDSPGRKARGPSPPIPTALKGRYPMQTGHGLSGLGLCLIA